MPNIIKVIFAVSIFTVSFDVFLTVDLGGTIRITQILALIVIAYTLLNAWNKREFYVPLGGKYLFIWITWLLLCVARSNELERSIGYWLWLAQDGLLVLAISNLLHTQKEIYLVLRIYILSFVFVSAFGLFQFFSTPVLGVDTPMVAQWWIYGVLARINGFSYEPSFFATYLLIGWTILYVLWRKKNTEIFPLKLIKAFFLVESLAMILSSSRMGIAMIFFICLEFVFSSIYTHIRKGDWKRLCISFVLVFVFLLCGGVISEEVDFSEYDFLLAGTGIGGRSAHSVDERSQRAMETLEVFLENPIIGVGIGGIPEVIGRNENVSSNIKDFEGSTVFFEVLAASGVIGVIPFILYFLNLLICPVRAFMKKKDDILLALSMAFMAEFIILQFNQNILRPYVWLHIAILSKYYRYTMRLA